MNQSNIVMKLPPPSQTAVVQKIKIFPKPEIKRLKVPPIKVTREPNQ